jgi:sulfur relay (sulfurtransferase) DsrF/TusC family protein
MVESVVIITDQSPVGKNSAAEAIRIGSGFVALGEYIKCQVIFTGDAIYLLNKNADPNDLGMDSNDEVLEIADLSDLELCIIDTDLKNAGMTEDDLIEYESLKIITVGELSDLIDQADVCFRF